MPDKTHLNYIAGDWSEGSGEASNINPSNTNDVAGFRTYP